AGHRRLRGGSQRHGHSTQHCRPPHSVPHGHGRPARIQPQRPGRPDRAQPRGSQGGQRRQGKRVQLVGHHPRGIRCRRLVRHL
ncbi:MAG: hypothetical protein AVDCRST_MAG10-2840, partial [uncultured Acidimicrobiales bacterium]